MKILKWLLIVVLAIVALVLIIAAFVPRDRMFTNSIEIESSPRLIFAQVNSLQNWDNWSPFLEDDPEMTSVYSGPNFGVGNRQEWKSKKSGDGALEIVESINENKVVFALDFGMGELYQTWFILDRTPDFVNVTWVSKMDNLSYPMGRLMMTLFKVRMEKTFQRGLDNLKKYVEGLPADCISGEVEVVNVPARTVLAITSNVTNDQIMEFLQQSFGTIMGIIEANRLKATGAPITIYKGDETTVEWGATAAIPVNRAPAKLPEGIAKLDLPATKAVSVLHIGSYQTASDSYYKVLDYIMANGMEITGDSWEEYLTTPDVEDPMQIQTKIYFPVN
jgi:effector-binding domain-containing protein